MRVTKPHKYGAKPTTYNGVKYPSQVEARRARQLDILVKCSDVRSWSRHPVVTLGCPENTYRPDFHVLPHIGMGWYEEVKGAELKSWRRNKRLWKRYGPCDLRVLKWNGSSWNVEVVPGGASGGEA